MILDDRKRSIGKIVSVAADRFVVEMSSATDNFTVVGYDDIHYVAQLGAFVIIPVQAEYVVAEIVGLREREPGIERSKNASLEQLDKAFSAKFLDVVPVGMLAGSATFRFGVSTFPSLYADVLYVLDNELDRIFQIESDQKVVEDSQSGQQPLPTRQNALTIGRSVVFEGYDLKVKIDEFFGGHSAVLGNTGSGKSCTVATIIQSLFSKPDEYIPRGATFIVYDVNGEYRRAFSELPNGVTRLYLSTSKSPGEQEIAPLDSNETVGKFRLPHWFMSAEEWELLLRASEKTQQPVLRMALGLATLFSSAGHSELGEIRDHILASCITYILESDASTPTKKDRIAALLSSFNTDNIHLAKFENKLAVSYGEMNDVPGVMSYLKGFIQESVTLPTYRNTEFPFSSLEEALSLSLLYEEAHGNRQIRDYCSQMLTRYKSVKERDEFQFLRHEPNEFSSDDRKISTYVDRLVGIGTRDGERTKDAQIIIVDMNEAEDEVVEVVSAVTSRLVFDRLRRAEPRNSYPINMILEEAHRYVAERTSNFAIDAGRIFERIAKEGRKYGVFLTVASQRPSELSKTVLSQCSNYVVHRIQNPDDLSHIRQMTPFISESVLKRLPSLPKQHALIFGNSVNIPTTFKVRTVDPAPKSADARISEIWYRPEGFQVDLAEADSVMSGSELKSAIAAPHDFDPFELDDLDPDDDPFE